MNEIHIFNTSFFKHSEFEYYLSLFDEDTQEKVIRYRLVEDQIRCLIGRLLLLDAYLEENSDCRFKVQYTENYKPYIEGWKEFSISHSGDYVVVAFANEIVGVDIEKIVNVDIPAFREFLHPLEIEFIQNQGDSLSYFFKIWTRKEAVLKAVGEGLLGEPKTFSCLDSFVRYRCDLSIQEIEVDKNYSLSLATHGDRFKELQLIHKTDFLNL